MSVTDATANDSAPIEVGEIVASHRLPWSASEIGYFLSRLADEWEGYQLEVRASGNGIGIYVTAIDGD